MLLPGEPNPKAQVEGTTKDQKKIISDNVIGALHRGRQRGPHPCGIPNNGDSPKPKLMAGPKPLGHWACRNATRADGMWQASSGGGTGRSDTSTQPKSRTKSESAMDKCQVSHALATARGT